jgi:Protein of unknown function (DUF3431)
LNGKTKANFEMVIARYDEDISWSDNYKEFRTVYNKGGPTEYEAIPLENVGHLADTILRHIIDRYDTLADVTFFTHGSFNYRNDQMIREQGPCHRMWKDFVQVELDTPVCILRGDLPATKDKAYDYTETFGEVYERFFSKPYLPTFEWACGKIMSVSRRHIQNKPKAFYQAMLDWILSPHEGGMPSQHVYRTRGIYIERFILHAFAG